MPRTLAPIGEALAQIPQLFEEAQSKMTALKDQLKQNANEDSTD